MNQEITVKLARSLLSMILLMGVIGCATDVRIPREEAAEIAPENGVIFGSIRISVDSSLPDTSPTLAPGRKSAGSTHKLVIDCSTWLQVVLDIPSKVELPLSLGEELILVQKLPARRCRLDLVSEGGLLLPMSSPFGIIDIQGGRTIYFGAVELALPTQLAAGSRTRSAVADQKPRTVQALRAEYGTLFDDAQFQPVIPW